MEGEVIEEGKAQLSVPLHQQEQGRWEGVRKNMVRLAPLSKVDPPEATAGTLEGWPVRN